MTFTGVGGNNSGGYYTYPYFFTIGNTTQVPLMCDTFQNEITFNQSWTATVTPLLSGQGLFPDPIGDLYKAAGLIFMDVQKGTLDANTGNWAVWKLFDTSLDWNDSTGVENKYLALAASAPSSEFSNLVLFTPIPKGLGSPYPQEFIGDPSPAPEPASWILIGTGLLTLARKIRRRSSIAEAN